VLKCKCKWIGKKKLVDKTHISRNNKKDAQSGESYEESLKNLASQDVFSVWNIVADSKLSIDSFLINSVDDEADILGFRWLLYKQS